MMNIIQYGIKFKTNDVFGIYNTMYRNEGIKQDLGIKKINKAINTIFFKNKTCRDMELANLELCNVDVISN